MLSGENKTSILPFSKYSYFYSQSIYHIKTITNILILEI